MVPVDEGAGRDLGVVPLDVTEDVLVSAEVLRQTVDRLEHAASGEGHDDRLARRLEGREIDGHQERRETGEEPQSRSARGPGIERGRAPLPLGDFDAPGDPGAGDRGRLRLVAVAQLERPGRDRRQQRTGQRHRLGGGKQREHGPGKQNRILPRQDGQTAPRAPDGPQRAGEQASRRESRTGPGLHRAERQGRHGQKHKQQRQQRPLSGHRGSLLLPVVQIGIVRSRLGSGWAAGGASGFSSSP